MTVFIHNVPLDGGTVGSRLDGSPVAGLDGLFDAPPRVRSTRPDSEVQPAGQVQPTAEAQSTGEVQPTGDVQSGGDVQLTGCAQLTGARTDGETLPCREAEDADLWFADDPAELERAKALCAECPVRAACLAGALRREEPWGVWGGEIFQRGSVIARKRPRGRPSKAALARDRALAEAGARL